jgi:hypothetical protein
MSGYFLVRRAAIAGVALSPLGYRILLELVARGRVRTIAEVGGTCSARAFTVRARSHHGFTITTSATSCACA